MSFNIIIVIVFLVFLLVIAVAYRNSTLDKLRLFAGESVLFEESGVRVEQGGSPRSVIFNNCIIRVTDRRIIVAQKFLFSKNRYALRHVITYNSTGEQADLGAAFKKGYLIFGISRNGIRIEEKDGKSFIRIDIPESALTKGQFLRFNTKLVERFRGI